MRNLMTSLNVYYDVTNSYFDVTIYIYTNDSTIYIYILYIYYYYITIHYYFIVKETITSILLSLTCCTHAPLPFQNIIATTRNQIHKINI